jgi:DNA-binding transcriptional LysR family regulator
MLDLEDLRAFLKVGELGSFTRAAQHLDSSKSRVSLRIRALEAELGSRLFQRSTRAVRLTPDGEQLLLRARHLVDEAEDVAAMFQGPSTLRGAVRVDLPINFARDLFIPRLPELLAAHPQLAVLLSTTDRRVDVLREGFDCVLRVGALGDSRLVARKLGLLPLVNCASPAYLLKHGVPATLDDLDHHLVVHWSVDFGSDSPAFEHPEGRSYRDRPMRSVVTVNNADAYRAACLAGLGIIQSPRSGVRANLADGSLVEVLPHHPAAPMLVSLVHAHGRSVPKRVRAVMSWLAQIISPQLAPLR